MKMLSFYFILTMAINASFTKNNFISNNNPPQIPIGIRAFIDDSLYNFNTDYILLSTDIFPDSFQEVYNKRDTLFSIDIAGIIANIQGNINWTKKIRVSVGFKHHEVTSGTYYHDYFRNDDTLCGVTFSNQCYDYFMPHKLNPNYSVTIISIDSVSVQGTFVAEVDALWYQNSRWYGHPRDSGAICKGSLRPKEKLMIRGEFNVPVKKRIIIHKKKKHMIY